jgi:hypothetical protein
MKDKHLEVRILAQKFDQSIGHIDDNVRIIVNECLRSKSIQEINRKSGYILDTALQKHMQLSYDSLAEGEEIVIISVRVKSKNKTTYIFNAVPKSDLKHFYVDGTVVKTLTIEDFRNQTKHLTNSILNGEKDALLGLDADKMLWDIM